MVGRRGIPLPHPADDDGEVHGFQGGGDNDDDGGDENNGGNDYGYDNVDDDHTMMAIFSYWEERFTTTTPS